MAQNRFIFKIVQYFQIINLLHEIINVEKAVATRSSTSFPYHLDAISLVIITLQTSNKYKKEAWKFHS